MIVPIFKTLHLIIEQSIESCYQNEALFLMNL